MDIKMMKSLKKILKMLLNPFLKTDLIFQRYKTYEYNLYYILKFSFSSTRLKLWAFSLTKFCKEILNETKDLGTEATRTDVIEGLLTLPQLKQWDSLVQNRTHLFLVCTCLKLGVRQYPILVQNV